MSHQIFNLNSPEQLPAARFPSSAHSAKSMAQRPAINCNVMPARSGKRSAAGTPSVDLGKWLAFEVAESALQGSDDDDDEEFMQPVGRRVVSEPFRAQKQSELPLTARTEASWPTALSHSEKRDSFVTPLQSPIGSPNSESNLSPAASPFEYRPRYKLPWDQARRAPPSPATRVSSVIRSPLGPRGPALNNKAAEAHGALGSGKGPQSRPRPKHTRSHSDHSYPFVEAVEPATTTAKAQRAAEKDQVSLPPAPPLRSLTPQPFKRSTFAEAIIRERSERLSILNCGRRPGLPSLAEIRAAAEKKGMSRKSSNAVPRPQTSHPKMGVNQKRLSMESTSSCGSMESYESASSAGAEPLTPVRSRLPSFLLRARTDSSSSSESSPITRSSRPRVIFSEPLKDAPTLAAPLLRVVPPTLETVHGQQDHEGAPVPVITCTPATAPSVKMSPLAELDAQICTFQVNQLKESKRQERARTMISTLNRRTKVA